MTPTPWYMAVSTVIDPSTGFYRPNWSFEALTGYTPAEAMVHAASNRVYLMWHIDETHFLVHSVPEEQIPLVDPDNLRMVIKSDLGRVLMLDACHKDELAFSLPRKEEDITA